MMPMILKPQVMIAILIVAAGGFAYLQTARAGDPLAEAHSGVAANLVVHAAILEMDGTPISGMSAKFKPVKPSAASLEPASVGVSLQPLYGFTADSAIQNRQYLFGGCTPMTNTLTNTWSRIPSVKVTREVNGFVATKGQETAHTGGIGGATVSLYKGGNWAGMMQSTLTASGVGRGTYSFGDLANRIVPGDSVYTQATKQGFCPAVSASLVDESEFFGPFLPTEPQTGSPIAQPPPQNSQPHTASPPSPGTPGSNCMPSSDPLFRTYLREHRGLNPDCLPNDLNYVNGLFADYHRWLATSQAPTSAPVNNPQGPNAAVTVTISGEVLTKNLAQNVRVNAEMQIKTATGKTFTRQFNAVEVPIEGGQISGLATTLELPKADFGTGRTVMSITVTATSQDHTGATLQDKTPRPIELYADTDFRGVVRMSVTAAGSALSLMGADGPAHLVRHYSVVPARPGE